MRRGEFIAGSGVRRRGRRRDSTGLVRVRLQQGIVTPALVTAVLALSACASHPPTAGSGGRPFVLIPVETQPCPCAVCCWRPIRLNCAFCSSLSEL